MQTTHDILHPGAPGSATGLVSSKDVTGTSVYSLARKHLGDIDHLVIDKKSGQVAYAVIVFGGFMGLGEGEYAIPWKKLAYDAGLNAFVTDLTKEQVTGAPSTRDNWFDDPDYHIRIHDHYGIAPSWRS
jgi:sporulation protein YlmC with PRC-barrel domain